MAKPVVVTTQPVKKETPSLKLTPKPATEISAPIPSQAAEESATVSLAQLAPFTLENLQAKWHNYKQKRAEEGKLNESDNIIFNKELELVEGSTIKLKISNTLERDILARFEMDLLGYLRKELSNTTIQIVTDMVQPVDTGGKKLYTSKDKLEYMLSKNNNLKKLQELLGLDADF